MCLFTCLPLFVSTLSSGVRLCGCLFFAFTCFSSFVSYHVSPNLSVSRLYNLSPIIRLLLDLSPKSFVSNHMYALVAVSLVASLFLIPVSCLSLFFPLLCLLVVSRSNHVRPWLYAFYRLSPSCLLPCLPLMVSDTNGVAKIETRGMKKWCLWFMLSTLDMEQTLPVSGAIITTNMHTDAAMDME